MPLPRLARAGRGGSPSVNHPSMQYHVSAENRLTERVELKVIMKHHRRREKLTVAR